MNTLMNINPQEDIPENEFFKVYFNEINFEGKVYNLTIAVDKEDNNLYFFPNEVGKILGFENLGDNLRKNYEKDIDYIKLENHKLLKLRELTMEWITNPLHIKTSHVLLLTESGLYAVIFKSRKKIAKQFRIKVTSEILPKIRRAGGYLEGFDEKEIKYITQNRDRIKELIYKEAENSSSKVLEDIKVEILQIRESLNILSEIINKEELGHIAIKLIEDKLLNSNKEKSLIKNIDDIKVVGLKIKEGLKLVKEFTNIDETDMYNYSLYLIHENLLPLDDETIKHIAPKVDYDEYNPTELAGLLGLEKSKKGAIKVNKMLEKLGLQIRKPNGNWTLTKKGLKYAIFKRVPKKYDKKYTIICPYWTSKVLTLLKKELSKEEN